MRNRIPNYLFVSLKNWHSNAILFNRPAYLCIRYKNNLHPKFFCLFTVKGKLEKYGFQDIIHIEIASLTIVHNRKMHIPFFKLYGILSFLNMVPLPALPFLIVHTNPMFYRYELRSGVSGVCYY